MTTSDTMDSALKLSLPRRILTVFFPFAFGYYLSYLYRSVNAIIADDLVEEIGLSAADLGLLTAAYFLAFAAFQLPLGLLLDRFGPRRVQAALLLSAAVGASVFALGDSKTLLIVGRALIGLGVAGGLMASFTAIVLWFPPSRWALVNGWFTTMGGLGALSATVPVEMLLGVTDWRGVFFGLSLFTVLTSCLIFFAVPKRNETGEAHGFWEAVQGIGQIYSDRLFWRMAPAAVLTFSAGMSIQGLWSGPWLRDVVGLERGDVASHLLVQAAAMTAGFALNGVIADYFARRGVKLLTVMTWGMVIFMLVQLAMVLGFTASSYLLIGLFGATSNWALVSYPILSGHFPEGFSGRANTALNVLVFGGAFATQYAIGAIIDLWPQDAGGGYALEAYSWAFGVFLALEVVAFLWLLLPHKERTARD
jgi:MFS family permease